NRVWTEVYPDSKAPTGAAKLLSPIVDKFGIERVAAELGKYLRATEAAYLSLPKFCSTFGGANRDAKAQSPTAYAARLIRFYVDHGFSQVLPIEQHDARIDELAAEHKIKDPDRVKRELRIVAPWRTRLGRQHDERNRPHPSLTPRSSSTRLSTPLLGSSRTGCLVGHALRSGRDPQGLQGAGQGGVFQRCPQANVRRDESSPRERHRS